MTNNILKNYIPKNEQEKIDKKLILGLIRNQDDLYLRTNLAAHFTSSVIILNETMDEILLGYHLIFQNYAWFGGHNDGLEDFYQVALKEAYEETGLKELKPLSKEPLMLDVIHVSNHLKNGIYVPDHLHLNLTYFFKTKESYKNHVNKKEHRDIKWFKVDDFMNHINEKRMVPIYTKVIKIIKNFKEKEAENEV